MTGYRLLAGNASAALAGRVVAIVLGVVLATVLFRALGAPQYGVWSLLTLISGYSTLIDFGLSSAIERRPLAILLVPYSTGRIVARTMSTPLHSLRAIPLARSQRLSER